MMPARNADPSAGRARAWLAAVIAGKATAWPFAAEPIPGLAAAAQAEEVAALVHWRIADSGEDLKVPPEFLDALAALARDEAVRSLVREHECRSLLVLLEQAGIEVLLLKGSALAYWAYPSARLRSCTDIDLLFRQRADVDRALPLLARLGYAPRERTVSGDTVGFELTCVRGPGLPAIAAVDLHWRLASTPLFAFRFENAELWEGAIALPRLASNAQGLAPVTAYLHACMHRVQNMSWGGHDRLKWLYDLQLLGSAFDDDEWRSLVELARGRGLAGTCHDAMDAVARAFGDSVPASVRENLRDASASENMDIGRMNRWGYIEWMNFRAFPDRAMRMRWLRQRLLPGRAYLEDRYGGRNQGSFLKLMAMRVRAAWRRLKS